MGETTDTSERAILVRFPGRDKIDVDGDASLSDLLLLREYIAQRIRQLSDEEFPDEREKHL